MIGTQKGGPTSDETLPWQLNRREFLALVGFSAISILSISSIYQLINRGWNTENIRCYSLETARAFYYKIRYPRFNRAFWHEKVLRGEVTKQKYPLSCEFASTCHLLALSGHKTNEDRLIDLTSKSINPALGVHPSIKAETRLGLLPPNPYGVMPQPIAETLDCHFLSGTNLHAVYLDYRE